MASNRHIVHLTRVLPRGTLRVFVWLLFLYANTAFSQQHYNFYHLKIDDGLAHNNVFEVYQDRNNYIWIGAGTKLQRYDGTRFITYEHEKGNINSLAFGHIRSILEDSQGILWIGTDGGGLSKFENGVFETFKKNDRPGSIQHNNVEQIIEMPDSSLYMASWGGGISIYKDGVFTSIKHDENDPNTISGNNVAKLLYDEETKKLWVGTWGAGLCYIKDHKVYRFPKSPEGFNSNKARVLAKTPDGSIWIGSWGDGLFRYKDGEFVQYSTKNGSLENDNVLTLTVQENKLWIGTWGGGITLYSDGIFTTYRQNFRHLNTIGSDFIESSMVDQNGNLWFGSYGGGITKFEKTQFSFFEDVTDRDNKYSSKFIRNIEEDANGRIWIAGIAGIYISDSTSFRHISDVYPEFPNLGEINSLCKTDNNDIWIGGSTGIGLYQFDGHRLIDRSKWNNVDFRDYFIHDIMQSRDGSIWICADVDAGLNQIKGDTVLRYFHDPEDEHTISSNNLYAAIESSDSSIWISTSRHGISVFKGGQFTRHKSNDTDSSSLSNDYVYTIIESKKGAIWIGTEQGLNQYDPVTKRFKTFLKSDGLLDNTILSITEDDQNNLWMGSHRGVSKMNPTTMSFQNFDHRSGIKGHPFHRGAIHQSSTSKVIYMGGVNGLLIFHPDTVKQYQTVPTVRITNVLVNNSPLIHKNLSFLNDHQEDSSFLVLDRFKGSLAFEYSDMNFGSGEEIQYSYKIFDLEKTWNFAGNNFTARYSNLPPGEYLFEVRSSVDGAKWNAPSSLKFKILPYWWETTWFKVLEALLVIGLIPVLIILRFSILQRQRKKLEQLVEEKTVEVDQKNQQIIKKSEALANTNTILKKAMIQLKELQDQQIIFQENERQAISREVHDSISSTLFGIRLMVNKSLSEVNQNDSTIQVPVVVDELLEQVIRDSQIILNNLSTSFNKHTSFYDSLNDLVTQSKNISHAEINLEWNGPAHITELNIGSNIFRIIQEALANSLKHSKANHISIHFSNVQSMQCMISDDGVGFDTASEEDSGYGLQNMYTRAKEINGKLDIQSTLDQGTIITLEVER